MAASTSRPAPAPPAGTLDQSPRRDNARPVATGASRRSLGAVSQRYSNDTSFIRDANQSYPVDLHQVSARLFQIAAMDSPEREISPMRGSSPVQKSSDYGSISDSSAIPSPCSSPGTRTPPTRELRRLRHVQSERRYYAKLVHDGSWPWYPIHSLENVSRDPEAYDEMLEYWQFIYPPDKDDGGWAVYSYQWARWKRFRKWQAQMREEHRDTFDQYFEETASRLDGYNCTLHLKRDPKQQDPLTTYYEYWCYELIRHEESWWYMKHEQEYKDAWGRLMDSGAVMEDEDPIDVESPESKRSREDERKRLREEVEVASSVLLLAERDRLDPSLKRSEVYNLLEESQVRLDTAINRFNAHKRYLEEVDKYLQTTASYRVARDRSHNHGLLMCWIEKEIDRIRQGLGVLQIGTGFSLEAGKNEEEDDGDDEEEEDDEDMAMSHSPISCSSKRNRSDDGTNDQCPKRIRGSSQTSHPNGREMYKSCSINEDDESLSDL